MNEHLAVWYYVLAGKRMGPVSLDEIRELIESGKVRPETKVWSQIVRGEWQAARDTALSEIFALLPPEPPEPPPLEPSSLEPPPLPSGDKGQSNVSDTLNETFSSVSEQGKRVFDEIQAYTVTTTAEGKRIDDRPIWAVVVVLLLIVIIGWIFKVDLRIISGIVALPLCFIDWQKLKADGLPVPSGWWILFTPVYLWKRAELLKQKKHYVAVWMGIVAISTAISLLSPRNAALESIACSTVTDILQKQYHQRAYCQGLRITGKSGNEYDAKATLSNGEKVRVRMRKSTEGGLYVEILP